MTQDSHARFLELHMGHQKTLLGYLLTAVRDFQQAEDLLQKITLILWEHYRDHGEPASYLPWAFAIARKVVARHFRDSQKREVTLPLEILDGIVGATESHADLLSVESHALAGCLEGLPGPLRDLIFQRYHEGLSLAEIAKRSGQTPAGVNMKLVRARQALLECARQSLAGEA